MLFLFYFIAFLVSYGAVYALVNYGLQLIVRAPKFLLTPADKLPPDVASHGAVWGGVLAGMLILGCGLALFFGLMGFGDNPPKNYGTVNGHAISKADYDKCKGKIPDGCPGGVGYLANKYYRSPYEPLN